MGRLIAALPRRMDGRDFGPQRSVHGPPPPLLSGLAMDSHRVGAATAGRLPSSGLPGPPPPGKYMAGLNLHPHPGKCCALRWHPPSSFDGDLRAGAQVKPRRLEMGVSIRFHQGVRETQLLAQREVGLQEDRPVPGVPGSLSPPEAQVSAVTATLEDPSPRALEEVEFTKIKIKIKLKKKCRRENSHAGSTPRKTDSSRSRMDLRSFSWQALVGLGFYPRV